jgi:hypothetical protein
VWADQRLSVVTMSVALRACVPWPFVALMNTIWPSCEPGANVVAFSLKVIVTVSGWVLAVPLVNDAFSQPGMPEIKNRTPPLDELSRWRKGSQR